VAVRLPRLVKILFLVLLQPLVVVRLLVVLAALVRAVGMEVRAALAHRVKAMLAASPLAVRLVFAWRVAVAVQEQLEAVFHQTLLVEQVVRVLVHLFLALLQHIQAVAVHMVKMVVALVALVAVGMGLMVAVQPLELQTLVAVGVALILVLIEQEEAAS
jgi:hypothetical protein